MELPTVSQQYIQIGNTITSFNPYASPFSSVNYEQRFESLNETKPPKQFSIVLYSSFKPINEENSMKNCFWQRNTWLIALSMLLLLALSLAACGNNGNG